MELQYLIKMKLPEKNILFVHIPKCGGSSIAAGLFDSVGIKFRTYTKVRGGNQYFSSDSTKHATAEYYKSNMKSFDDYYRFTVIRNPWERFVSQLNWHQQATRNKRVGIGHILDFDDTKMRRHIGKNRLFRPMTQFVLDENGECLVNDVFDLKQIGKIRERLEIKNINRKIRNANKIKNSLNEETYEKIDYIVNKFYKDDIEYFGYTKNEIATKNVTLL